MHLGTYCNNIHPRAHHMLCEAMDSSSTSLPDSARNGNVLFAEGKNTRQMRGTYLPRLRCFGVPAWGIRYGPRLHKSVSAIALEQYRAT
jgi:hypothetical protein